MTVADVARYLGIEVEPVLALRVDHTAALLRAHNRLNGDPHLCMLWQVRQRGEGLQDAGFIDGFNRLSLSRLNHLLPWGQAHPEVMQSTAQFHHQSADARFP